MLTENMIKFLNILEGFNYPPESGGDQAVYNGIQLLKHHLDYHIIVVTDNDNAVQRYKADNPEVAITFFPIRRKNRIECIHALCMRLQRLLCRCSGYEDILAEYMASVNADILRYTRMYQFINRYIKDHGIENVQTEFTRPLYWTQGIIGSAKIVFVQHEIHYVVRAQQMNLHENVSESAQMLYEIEKKSEIQAMNGCDAVITLSHEDRHELRKSGVTTNIYASFAKVTLRASQSQGREMCLTFVGPEKHIPNRQGLMWFLDEIFGELQQKLEHPIDLHIIGKWSTKTQKEWCAKYDHIHFDGFVPDLTAALRGSILIVPIHIGSGIRMKILEAANIGVAFVSTSVGSQGLGFIDGDNCFIADIASDFMQKTHRLIENEALRLRFIEASRQYVQQAFSDESFVKSRMVCYNNLTKSNGMIEDNA